jgi:hypothetical protein
MSLAVAASFAQIVEATVVLIGIFVGIDQLRQLRIQRRDTAAVELMRSVQDAEFGLAVRLLLALQPGASAAEVHARGRECEDAAMFVSLRFETLGVLVYRRAISLDVLEDLIGGIVVAMWVRLEDLAAETRLERNHPIWLEWFQWLAEQFMTRDRLLKTPAYEEHRNWRPDRAGVLRLR